jgi:mannan endo-1,4-beta-mannosidase
VIPSDPLDLRENSTKPRPVPELDPPDPQAAHASHSVLAVKSLLVALIVIVGVTISGIAPSAQMQSDSIARASSIHKEALPHHSTASSTTAQTSRSSTTPPTSTLAGAQSSTAPTNAPQRSVTITPSAKTASPTTAPAPIPDSGTIQASGTHLILNGSIYRFTGVNVYEAATDWGTNAGCGGNFSNAQLDQIFASLPPNSLVRFWAFQGALATNVNTHQLDWGPIDRVFDAAAAYGQRLIVVLTDQGGNCDGDHWQDPAWYSGGFMDAYNNASNSDGNGLTPLSYWDYMQDIVNRYKNSPALGMWEPISEPEASTCPAQYQPTSCLGHGVCVNEPVAVASLRYFFDTVGGEIHTLDPNHLVEAGFLGSGQCGTANGDYQYVAESPGIDVLSYHDYYGTAAIGGDQWNGLAVRFEQAAAANKPIIGGEVGLLAGPGPGCVSQGTRNAAFAAKEQAQFQAGSSGFLVWDWTVDTADPCSMDVLPADPLMQSGGAIG